jgi:TolB-like protein/Tfp pilus assembly protein PilF
MEIRRPRVLMPDTGVSNQDGSDRSRHRLESWKEIAAYLGRDVRTVQRWERRDGLPVHRLHHSKLGSVYAYRSELDAWRAGRDSTVAADRPGAARSTQISRHSAWILSGICALILAFGIGFSRVASRDAPSSPEFRVSSLAVLPLADLSQDPDREYFAEGMTDALIGRLSALRDLRVISRTSVMPFKGAPKPVLEIARVLNVNAVVEGTVLRSGDRVRITAQLVRADTGEILWSGSYDRELADVLALQSELAQVIARQIEASMSPAERDRLARTRAVSPEVYESYLKGLFHLHRRTRNLDESIRHFEEATAGDPTFAPAYAGLAAAYQASGSTGAGVRPVADAHPAALAAARKALQLDPELASAHALVAFAYQQQWQWTEAEAGYRRAIETDPNEAEAYSGLAGLLTWLGRTEEGIAYARRAREIDPLAADRTVRLGWLLYHARQYDEAIRELRTVLAAEPDHIDALWKLGFALVDSWRFGEAIHVLERLVLLWDRHPAALGVTARAYGRAGQRARALQVLDELKERERVGYVPPAPFVNAYVGLGDTDNALASLERAFQERSNIIQSLRTHPLYDPLRADPRFAELLRRAGLD